MVTVAYLSFQMFEYLNPFRPGLSANRLNALVGLSFQY